MSRPKIAPPKRRHTTVWYCEEASPTDGTGLIAGWLLNAVIRIIRTYSSPGDRVLLVAPPTSRLGRYVGLADAAWTASRLGRQVLTQTDLASGSPRPDQFDLIIVASGPDSAAVVRPTDWVPHLSRTGVLGVITHDDPGEHPRVDAVGPEVRALRSAGLRHLDHIALVHSQDDQGSAYHSDLLVLDHGATETSDE